MYPSDRSFLGLYTIQNMGDSSLHFPLLILFMVMLTIQVTTALTSYPTFPSTFSNKLKPPTPVDGRGASPNELSKSNIVATKNCGGEHTYCGGFP
jgi:hypothetical protein